MIRRLASTLALLSCALTGTVNAQTASRYPVRPSGLAEAEEVALAQSAAPAEVSSRADVYVLRGTEFVNVRNGTNGCACMVARDLHEGSLYPICFDQEAARSLMLREMKEVSLRAQGKSEAEVDREVKSMVASGALPQPSRTALAYMMSPRQVLFSSAEADGVRVGAWHPHIMMSGLQFAPGQLGFEPGSQYRYIQHSSGDDAGSLHEFVVLLPVWSDGTPGPRPASEN
jgi:hypothetical protein